MSKTRRIGGESRREFLMSFAGLSLLALSGCGGGGGGGPGNGPAVPTGTGHAVRILPVEGSGGWIFPGAFNAQGQLAGYTLGAGQALNAFFFDGTAVHPIDPPAGQGLRVSPQAVNASGRVVGFYEATPGVFRAFGWTLAGGFEPALDDLGASQARALLLNDRGSVAGFGQTGAGQAGLLRIAGEPGTRDLRAEAGIVAVLDLDGSDRVLGRTTDGSVLWSPAAAPIPIGAPGAEFLALHLNERGEVAGIRPAPGGGSLPFHWSEATGVTELSGDASFGWTLAGIDAEGRIAGYASQPLGGNVFHDRPFVWTRAGGLNYFDVPGGRNARVIALGEGGRVAGYFIDGGADRGFTWSAGEGFVDLTARLRDDAPAGLVVHQATALGPGGTVAGISNQGPVLLTPGT